MRDQIASTFVSRMQSRPPELDALNTEMAKLGEGDAAGRAAIQEKIDAVTEV